MTIDMRGNDFDSKDAFQREYISKDQIAYDALRDWIIGGKVLPSGAAIDHTTYAELLGLSRTPVRNAINRLVAEGLVVGESHKTPRVAPISADEYRDVHGARVAIEPMLIAHAIPNRTAADMEHIREIYRHQRDAVDAMDTVKYVILDRQFHRALYEPSGLKRSLAIFEQLRNISDRYTNLYVTDHARGGQSLTEHEEILRHFESGDTSRAKTAVKLHLSPPDWLRTLESTTATSATE